MNNQKGLAPLLIVILIALAVGGYFVYQKQTKSNPTPTSLPRQTTQPSPSPDASREPTGSAETANWKTYTNTKNGFSLKYPEDWYMGVSGDGTILFDNKPVDGKAVVEPDQVTITLDITTDKQLIDAYAKNVSGNLVKKVFNGISFDYITPVTPANRQGRPPMHKVLAQTVYNNNLYRVGLYNSLDQNIFDQMLSTFKFVP